MRLQLQVGHPSAVDHELGLPDDAPLLEGPFAGRGQAVLEVHVAVGRLMALREDIPPVRNALDRQDFDPLPRTGLGARTYRLWLSRLRDWWERRW